MEQEDLSLGRIDHAFPTCIVYGTTVLVVFAIGSDTPSVLVFANSSNTMASDKIDMSVFSRSDSPPDSAQGDWGDPQHIGDVLIRSAVDDVRIILDVLFIPLFGGE